MFASALDSTAKFQDFFNFSFAHAGFTSHHPPVMNYELQRKAISVFGWLERFRAMFTVTDETDMLVRNPEGLSFNFLRSQRHATLFVSLILSRVQAGRCLYDVSSWSGDLSHINHQY